MACRCELRKKIKKAAVPWIPDRTVYLDYNATTPVDPRVIGAFERACRRNWGNPSSLHAAGTAGWSELEGLYNAASGFFGTAQEGFLLCSSGTEAITASAYGLASREKTISFITTAVEHQAVKHPLFHLGRHSEAAPAGYSGKLCIIPVDEQGRMDLTILDKTLALCNKSALLYSPVNHETGAVQPVKEIAEIARHHGSIIIFDAVQAAVRLAPHEWVDSCDIFCISSHKLYAPKGSALMWKKPGLRLHTRRFGGSQEGGFFPGTENVPGAAALSEALSLMKTEQPEELRMLSALGRDGLTILEKAGVPFTLESPANSAPGVLCISLKDRPDMEKLILNLNSMNICLSRFSACTERLNGPSNTLSAMGRAPERTGSSIRISLGRWSRRDDFFKLAAALKKALLV
jgi:cysteine desulfurase